MSDDYLHNCTNDYDNTTQFSKAKHFYDFNFPVFLHFKIVTCVDRELYLSSTHVRDSGVFTRADDAVRSAPKPLLFILYFLHNEINGNKL